MTSKPVEEGTPSTCITTGFQYWAGYVVWAKITTNTFYSIIEWFNMQVFIYNNKKSKKNIYVVTYTLGWASSMKRVPI